ncbi:hypothetical protein [Rhodococcoides yunnanense]|uniref:hypothetical protein n=1 Tax=Rhodococcoides yunnanense TaxID=278209 RepID=UPI000934EB9A|nr:hypothetical protein [Rhodococcus yunnanensis]
MKTTTIVRSSVTAAAALLVFGALTACSDSGSTAQSGPVGDTESLTALYEGTEHQPPSESPAATAGANVW